MRIIDKPIEPLRSTADKESFIAMLKANKGILLKVIRAYCKNNEDWKDLEQEIIIQLWNSFARYDNQYKISTWMYRIALNVAISHYRKTRKEEGNHSLDDAVFTVVEDEPNETQNERRQLLYDFIGTLDELNKALIILHLEDHNHKEISDILGISESNVGTKINRIKNKFKATIKVSYEHK
jgi:RNA polymerase sigma-70 factor (ECF subfamily)